MRKILLGPLLLLLMSNTYADFFKKEDLAVAVGLQSQSLLYKRGMITYEGYQVLPIYAVSLFNPNLLLAGSSLLYKYNLGERLILRGRLNFDSTNDDPLYETDEDNNERVRREQTAEFDLFLEYSFEQGHYLRAQLSQDLVEHQGLYAEFHGRFSLGDYYKKGSLLPLVRPLIFASIGHGNSAHNHYLYGQGAKGSGVNNIEYGLMITSPKVIDEFWPTLKITRFEIVGTENKNASFVQEESGLSAEILFAFRVW